MGILKKLSFLWAFSPAFVILISYYVLGGGYWLITGTLYSYIIIPLIDEFVGRDSENVSKDQILILSNDKYFEILVHILVYVCAGIVVWGAYLLGTGELNWIQAAFLILSIGIMSTESINLAHELGHKQSKAAQFSARFALMTVSYMHFIIEHNKGHHVNVATPLDPATSRKGQTLYLFMWQSIVGGFKSAWHIEAGRLKRAGKSVWSIHNEMIWFMILPVLFCTALTLFFSWQQGQILWIIPIYFAIQSYIAFASLECVNYIEHYGITRREISPGKYERVNPLHSWNANHKISNLIFLQLQRHSDHHAYASRPYQVLRHFDESPQLPYGYPAMILMSLVPPLWFSVMDKRLEEWESKALDAEEIEKVVKAFA